MALPPPPSFIEEFEFNWRQWLHEVYKWMLFTAKPETVITTSHTIDETSQVILVDDDTAGGGVTITLPKASGLFRTYHIKKLGTTGNVTIDADGTETIDGALTAVINTQYTSLQIVSDDSNWHII